MIPIKINGKKLHIPTRWEDITFKQYIEYQSMEKNDIYGLLEAFTGIGRDSWEKSKEVEGFYVIMNALAFVAKKPNMKYDCPLYVKIDGKDVRVPKELDRCTVKQYEDMRALIQSHMKDKAVSDDVFPKIVAVYLCEEVTGRYGTREWEDTVPKVEELPFHEVVGIGNFFLRNLIELRSGTHRSWLHRLMSRRKYRQALKGLMRGVS